MSITNGRVHAYLTGENIPVCGSVERCLPIRPERNTDDVDCWQCESIIR